MAKSRVSVTRKLEFDAGHRVWGHGGKCRHLHGHRYVCEVTVEADRLNSLDMVIDFSVVKAKVGGWIDNEWDHNILLSPEDPLLSFASGHPTLSPDALWQGKPPYIMKAGNPTAEKIAEELFVQASRLLSSDGISVTNVRVWETPNCYADFSLPRK